MSGHIWYSYGSDTTGPKLAKALGFQCGKKRPNFGDYDVVIGFGCKPKDLVGTIPAVVGGGLRVINHPDTVEQNRNKAATLCALGNAGISVPGMVPRNGVGPKEFFEQVKAGLEGGVLDFPIIGMHSHHRGQAHFCYTLEDVQAACATNGSRKKDADKIDYFRSFCPGTEFRIHVLRDMAICAQMKTLASDPEKQTFESLKSTLSKRAKKEDKGLTLNRTEVDWVLHQMAEELLRGPSQLLRSIGRGWLLEDVNLNEVPVAVVTEAINALEAGGLDLGAVSVTFDETNARVTGITSAPAIEGDSMGAYVGAIQEFMKDGAKTKKKAAKKKKKEGASPELIARVTRKLRGVDAAKVEEMLESLNEE